MEARKKVLSLGGQLDDAKKNRAVRSALVTELQNKNSAAQKEIELRNKQIDFLLQAQDVEHRIVALLTHLSVKQDEDRYLLLLQERETLDIVLKTLEGLRKSAS